MSTAFTPLHRGGSGPPLVLIHGFTDTWRTWELVIPRLEQQFEVLAVTMTGHAGGPPAPERFSSDTLPDGIAAAMDEAGFEAAHLAGNSLGGFVALQLASRGRALSVTGLAPAGGWSAEFQNQYALDYFITQQELVKKAAAFADRIASTPEGRRQATRFIVEDDGLITPEMVVHQLIGDVVGDLHEHAHRARTLGAAARGPDAGRRRALGGRPWPDVRPVGPLGDPSHSVRRQGTAGAGAVDPPGDQDRLQVAEVRRLELGSGVGDGPGGSEAAEQVGEPFHASDGTEPVLRPADPQVPNR